jgi:hypothetical protein
MGSLALMCAMAFAGVFLLLTVLSVLMTALTALFPPKEPVSNLPAVGGDDAAVVAAITATMKRLYPGGSVSRIEEKK